MQVMDFSLEMSQLSGFSPFLPPFCTPTKLSPYTPHFTFVSHAFVTPFLLGSIRSSELICGCTIQHFIHFQQCLCPFKLLNHQQYSTSNSQLLFKIFQIITLTYGDFVFAIDCGILKIFKYK